MGQDAEEKPEEQVPGFRGVGTDSALRNRLLSSLPTREFKNLRPFLEACELAQHDVLHESTSKQQFVYFPCSGLVSLVVSTEDGSTVETGMVGREGLAGLASVVGVGRSPLRQVVQIAGDGFRIRVGDLHSALDGSPELQSGICRYAVIMGMQVAQIAACNRLHDAVQRLARWLLMARDRVGGAPLPITHDFLAAILGTDRPSVSLAAKILQRKKLIDYKRGKIGILNAKRLENASCECYRVIRGLVGVSKTRERSG
jgi:CRP-like cAMP-binding protein